MYLHIHTYLLSQAYSSPSSVSYDLHEMNYIAAVYPFPRCPAYVPTAYYYYFNIRVLCPTVVHTNITSQRWVFSVLLYTDITSQRTPRPGLWFGFGICSWSVQFSSGSCRKGVTRSGNFRARVRFRLCSLGLCGFRAVCAVFNCPRTLFWSRQPSGCKRTPCWTSEALSRLS